MYIEIESEELNITTITSRKTGALFFVAEQGALIFKEESKYPEHFTVRHCFTESKLEAESAIALKKGRYSIRDSAFTIDRYKNLSLDIAPKHLRMVTPMSIPQQAKAG